MHVWFNNKGWAHVSEWFITEESAVDIMPNAKRHCGGYHSKVMEHGWRFQHISNLMLKSGSEVMWLAACLSIITSSSSGRDVCFLPLWSVNISPIHHDVCWNFSCSGVQGEQKCSSPGHFSCTPWLPETISMRWRAGALPRVRRQLSLIFGVFQHTHTHGDC